MTTATTGGTAIVDAAALALALKVVKPAVASKGLPLLAHVHLVGMDDTLAVEATDLELGLSARVGALTDGVLDVCLPYAALARLIDPARSGDVTLAVEEAAAPDYAAPNWTPGKTSLTQGKRVARIDTASGADFPVLARYETADIVLAPAQWSRVRSGL
ncbi:MAG: hypothetical protein KGK07_17570, partial [Chloroflexota bacterium]|nr:hypothetical protein [Chloroflexota bacterium]